MCAPANKLPSISRVDEFFVEAKVGIFSLAVILSEWHGTSYSCFHDTSDAICEIDCLANVYAVMHLVVATSEKYIVDY